MIKELTPDELKYVQVVSVQKIGGYWNWRRFRREPIRFMIFTANGIFEWMEDK